jgi:rubrerythrin
LKFIKNIIAMVNSLKGTQTEQNLLKSFAGESQARNRYEFFASIAKKEGYEQIAAIFMETSNQEKEHAKRFFKFLEGGMTEITAAYPAGIIGTTMENLKAAAEGEHEEWTELYPHFSEVAKEEGFSEIAVAFRMIAKVEAEHERRYLKLLQNISEDKVFVKDGKVWWKCLNCGYVYESLKAMESCPACLHPKSYMQVREDNY